MYRRVRVVAGKDARRGVAMFYAEEEDAASGGTGRRDATKISASAH
jgi:hypothetical protein